MAQINWNEIARREFIAMDKSEQADWADLRAKIKKRR
jgi:hypothetical protein